MGWMHSNKAYVSRVKCDCHLVVTAKSPSYTVERWRNWCCLSKWLGEGWYSFTTNMFSVAHNVHLNTCVWIIHHCQLSRCLKFHSWIIVHINHSWHFLCTALGLWKGKKKTVYSVYLALCIFVSICLRATYQCAFVCLFLKIQHRGPCDQHHPAHGRGERFPRQPGTLVSGRGRSAQPRELHH